MNEMIDEKKKVMQDFFRDYGKLCAALLTLLLGFICCLSLSSSTSQASLKVSFLDIGQGDAILIQTPNGHDMLIDGGPNDRILEKLSEKMSYFDRHLDIILETHPDADHITGLIPVLKKYDVSNIITSPILGHTGIFDELEKHEQEERADMYIGERGDEIIFGDGVQVRVLYPSKNFHGSSKATNDASVSVLVTYGEQSILLTGDLPSEHEGEIVRELMRLEKSASVTQAPVTIYKAGHHGSKYSSGDKLLSYIQPNYTVISAGKDNRYGHPNPEAVGRLEKYSHEILSTIDHGTVSFLLDGRHVKLDIDK